MEARPLPDQFTTTALGLNIGPVHYKYSIKTCQLWPGCPHFMNGKAEAQRRPFRSSGSSLPWSVLYVWAPCLGQGVGFSPCLPWKEELLLFADDMILYIQNPKDSTRNLVELINEFGKAAGYKLMHRNLLHSYILMMKNLKEKLRKYSHLPLQQKEKNT